MHDNIDDLVEQAKSKSRRKGSVLDPHRELVRRCLAAKASLPAIVSVLKELQVSITKPSLREWVERHMPEMLEGIQRKKRSANRVKPALDRKEATEVSGGKETPLVERSLEGVAIGVGLNVAGNEEVLQAGQLQDEPEKVTRVRETMELIHELVKTNKV